MKRLFFSLLLALLSLPACAHKSSDSYLALGVATDGRVSGRWDIALRDLDLLLPLDADNDRRLTWGEVLAAEAQIHALAARSLQLRSAGGACLLDSGGAPLALEDHVDGRYVVLSLQGSCPDVRYLEVGYDLLAGIDAAHRGVARLVLAEAERAVVLVPGTTLRLEAGGRFAGWRTQVREGMHHIATGYDHLLFLLSLLLPVALLGVPARGGGQPTRRAAWRSTLVLVTAFTLAHSLTLALATFGLVHLPSRLVESAIAASVLVAALHNVMAEQPGTRWIMAFAFGLVHGLGFATVLGELPSATGPRLLALAGFNIGVELGQLFVVAGFLPLAIFIAGRDRSGYRRWGVQGGSLLIASLAFVWFFQRLLGWQLIPG